jgi:hypothetical protein
MTTKIVLNMYRRSLDLAVQEKCEAYFILATSVYSQRIYEVISIITKLYVDILYSYLAKVLRFFCTYVYVP